MNKKALLQPSPWYFWAILAATFGIPLYFAVNPHKAVTLLTDRTEALRVVEDAETMMKFRALFERVGLKHADKVVVVETRNYGPTSVGMDSRFGSVVLIPRTISALWDPTTEVVFPGLYEGPVGEMPSALRAHLLETEGTLVLTPEQCEFIIGHEAVHLKQRHVLESTKIAALVALATHAGLKASNGLADLMYHRTGKEIYRRLQLRSTPLFAALVVACTALVTAGVSWDQELQADAESAHRLGLFDPAINLKNEQLRQGSLHEAQYGKTPLWNRDFEHPPTSLQLHNLKQSMMRAENLKQQTTTNRQ